MRAGGRGGKHLVLAPFFTVQPAEHHAAVSLFQGQFHGLRQSGSYTLLYHQPVYNEIQAVLAVLVQGRDLVHKIYLPVHTHALIALGFQLFQSVLLRALLQKDKRGNNQDLGALFQFQNLFQDFIYGAGLNGAPALRAVHGAKAGKKDAQEVIDFGHSRHCGAGIVACCSLLKGNSRRQALYLLNVGLVHPGQKLPCIGREGLDIAALSLGIHDVKGQRGLA